MLDAGETVGSKSRVEETSRVIMTLGHVWLSDVGEACMEGYILQSYFPKCLVPAILPGVGIFLLPALSPAEPQDPPGT